MALSRKAIDVPAGVEQVFREFRTCEMSTLARDGTPISWPVLPFWRPENGRFLITTSIGLPQKAFNAGRDPRVSLLFSDPTASGLADPPAVLVQGEAEVTDEPVTAVGGFEKELRELFRRQPAGGPPSGNPLSRYLFDWYYMRLMIHVSPLRVSWWPGGDFGQPPIERVMDDVA